MIHMLLHIWCKFTKIARGRSVRRSQVHPTSKVEAGSTLIDSSMDKHSFCGYDCTILNADIGAFASIANRVSIGRETHPMHFVSMSPVFLSHKDSVKAKFATISFPHETRTVIGSDVWIGDGAFVKAGTRIGDGAVVGMGAVVTRDVPDFAIVAGNPARVVRYRFDEPIRSALAATNWWSLEDEVLSKVAALVDNPAAFIDAVKKL